jgi:hypothetical protein
MTQKMKQIFQPQSNLQIRVTLQYAGARGCATIHAPVSSVDDDAPPAG